MKTVIIVDVIYVYDCHMYRLIVHCNSNSRYFTVVLCSVHWCACSRIALGIPPPPPPFLVLHFTLHEQLCITPLCLPIFIWVIKLLKQIPYGTGFTMFEHDPV